VIINQTVSGGSSSTGPNIPYSRDSQTGALKLGSTGIDIGGATNIDVPYFGYRIHYNDTDFSGTAFVNAQNLTDINVTNDSILYCAFTGCTNLTSTGLDNVETITIGSSLLSNGFQDCTSLTRTGLGSLTTVTGSSSLLSNLFKGCTSLTDTELGNLTDFVLIPGSSYSSIYPSSWFEGCTSLTSTGINWAGIINLPSSFSSMFKSCTSLTSTGLNRSVSTYSFLKRLSSTFMGCTSLTSTGIDFAPDTEIYLGTSNNSDASMLVSAFRDCTSLTSTGLDNLKKLSGGTSYNGTYGLAHAFEGCTSLTRTGLGNLVEQTAIHGLDYAFKDCTSLTSTELGNCKKFHYLEALYYTFQGCTSLTSTGIDFSQVTFTFNPSQSSLRPFEYTFDGCTSLTDTGLSNLEIVTQNNMFYYTFQNCTGLTNYGIGKLLAVTGSYAFSSAFSRCGATSIEFTNLCIASGSSCFSFCFSSSPNLTTISFPALHPEGLPASNPFTYLVSSVTGCTIHFPSNLETQISGWTFSGTNTVVLFDLPAVPVIKYMPTGQSTAVTLFRAATHDTGSNMGWYLQSSPTWAFTSGTTQPSVGDNVYSDSACTTVIGTIDSIA